MVGEFLVPRLGGEPELWAAANATSIEATFQRFVARLDAWQEGVSDYAEALRQYDLDWLELMCEAAGIAPPESVDDRLTLSREAADWIMPRVRADHPGAVDAIRGLSLRYEIYMASRRSVLRAQKDTRSTGRT